MTPVTYINSWPESPYKGLNYYDSNDVPIFTGRDQDITDFSQVIDESRARIIVLQGETGCGKSSFLRAGLVPFLEGYGYEFLKKNGGDSAKDHASWAGLEFGAQPLFIQSSEMPLVKIATAVFGFVSEGYSIRRPNGEITSLKIAEALMGKTSEKEYVQEVAYNPQSLIESLGILSKKLPNKLILIIDQAEEVVTLNPGEDYVDNKDLFFEFLAGFSNEQMNLKLLLSLRTEYYGRFISGIHPYKLDMSGFRNYYIKPLGDKELARAIVRPTLKTEIEGYGRPRDYYKFSYADGLVPKIVSALMSTNLAGGRLPAMQIICKRLYEATRKKAHAKGETEWVINESDYAALGKVTDQINAYLDETLEQAFKEVKGLEGLPARVEIVRWKRVLLTLADTHSDGTVTKRPHTKQELFELAKDHNSRILEGDIEDIEEILEFLAKPQHQILRKEKQWYELAGKGEIIDRKGEIVDLYTLAHDAIGLGLKEWEDNYERLLPYKRRQDPALIAAAYTSRELYGEKPPARRKLSAANDFIWDHQIMLFAKQNGFFERLGLDLEIRNYDDYGKATEIFLPPNEDGVSDEANALLAYPRCLLGRGISLSSTDFAVTNVFTGYALIGRKNSMRFEQGGRASDSNEFFKHFFQVMGAGGCSIEAEDKGARDFMLSVEEVIKAYYPKSRITLSPRTRGTDRERLFGALDRSEVDFIVGTAPTRAFASQLGYPIYLDFTDVYQAIDSLELPEAAKNGLKSKFVLHNCWNINVSTKEWHKYRELILRLASVALFSLDFLRADREKFIKFLLDGSSDIQLSESYQLDSSVMLETFQQSYDFVLSENYFDTYIDPESLYNYESRMIQYYKEMEAPDETPRDLFNADNVYKELLKLKQEYFHLVDQFSQVYLRSSNGMRKKMMPLKEQARKHYHIHNYVDAVCIMKEALNRK